MTRYALALFAATLTACSSPAQAPPDASATCGPFAHANVAEGPDGGCAFVCEPTFADCDGDPANGCETATAADPHCGECHADCAAAGGVCAEQPSGHYRCEPTDAGSDGAP
ncbi:MAG TPA: hypothetical protein VNW46_05420 [Gemmatimonadaceae bacterium]|jgi:hypothetical protein|nr:hypothetical protein [Gemmatimonadaceae bacterium]